MQRARTWATTCGECPAGTGVRQAGPNKRRGAGPDGPAPCLCGAENGLFTLLPDFGESRFHFMLFLLTGFGRRSLALFNQTIDVTLEILLARFAGGVFVLFHGFGNFMVSTPAANSAPFARPFIPANKKNGQLRRIVRFGSGRRTRIPDIQYCISNNYKPIHLEIYSNKVYLLIYSNILISIIHIYFLT